MRWGQSACDFWWTIQTRSSANTVNTYRSSDPYYGHSDPYHGLFDFYAVAPYSPGYSYGYMRRGGWR
jgi:hypothetical protein